MNTPKPDSYRKMKRDQHAGKHSLDSFLFIAGSREHQGDASIFFLDADLGLCATYIIDGGFGHGNNSGDGGTDNVGTSLSITAVTRDGESGDSVVLGEKFAFRHSFNYRATLVISTLV